MKVLVPETMPPTAYEWEGPIADGRDEDEVRGFRN